jgi:hypothetical protein
VSAVPVLPVTPLTPVFVSVKVPHLSPAMPALGTA